MRTIFACLLFTVLIKYVGVFMSANVIAKIDKQLEGLSPESLRYQVLVSLRKFRSSWVELGKYLTDIAYGGDYKEWGFDDFEVYCASELGLKKPTVKKLMVSYNYMKSYEPDRLRDGSVEEKGYDVPDYQTVELLKKARERDDIEDEEKEELHRMAFDSNADEGVLRKEIRDRMHPVDPDDIDRANFNRRREIEGLLRVARSLRQKLSEAKSVPDGVKNRIEEALLELEALD